MIAVLLFAAFLAYLGLGAFVSAPLRKPATVRPRPKLELVRDRQLDISRAIDRGSR